MSDHEPTGLSRRQLLKTGALLAAAPILGATRPAAAQTPAKSTKVLDFQTGADVAKAEQEGEVVYYGHDGEAGIAALLEGREIRGLFEHHTGELTQAKLEGYLEALAAGTLSNQAVFDERVKYNSLEMQNGRSQI